jgi:hypothetical protein
MQHSVHAHNRTATINRLMCSACVLFHQLAACGVNIAARHAAAIFVSVCAVNHHFSHTAVVTVMCCVFRKQPGNEPGWEASEGMAAGLGSQRHRQLAGGNRHSSRCS